MVGVVGWVVLFGWCLRPIWGMDIFSHVAIGRLILSTGIPQSDVLSAAHPEAVWSPFQVAYEVLVAWMDARGGLDALRFVHAGLFATGLWLVARFVRRQTSTLGAAAALTAMCLLLFDERLRLRPHAVNLLLEAAVLLPVAAGGWRLAPRRWLWGLPVVAFCWASMHALGALWLLAVLGTVAVAGENRESRRWGWTAFGLSALGTSLAPGAIAGISTVFGSASPWAAAYVPELAPSWAWFGEGSLYGLLCGALPWVALVSVVLAVKTRPERVRWSSIIAAAGLTFGALAMARLGYYAAFAVALCLPELRRLRPPPVVPILVAAFLSVVLLAHVAPRWEAAPPWTTTLQPDAFPEVEAATLKKAEVQARIFNRTEWGGYLLYVLHPGCTVLSDGRVIFSEDVGELLQWNEVPERRGAAAEAAYDRYGVDLLVRRRADQGGGVFPEGGPWELLLRGPVADIWSRRGPVTEQRKQALGRVLSP
ncbi:MAG: hypothetical protein VYE15_04420 [Myxococcota bacterium]|nr:hypothetical protein [Myxococcota bacterium]